MSKGIMKYVKEDIGNDTVMSDTDVDLLLSKQQNNIQDVDTVSNDIEVARDAQAVLEELSKLTDGKTLTALESLLLKTSTNYVLNQIGLNTNSVSLEGYTTNINKVGQKINTAITLAQEGMFARAVDNIKDMFVTSNSVIATTHKLLEKAKEKGCTDGVIKQPGWGRVFSFNKNKVSTKEVINEFVKNKNARNSPELLEILKKIKELTLISSRLSNMRDVNDKDEEDILKVLTSVKELVKKAKTHLNIEISKGKTDPDFEPLDVKGVEIIAEYITTIFNKTTPISKLINEIYEDGRYARADDEIEIDIGTRDNPQRVNLTVYDDTSVRKLAKVVHSNTDALYWCLWKITSHSKNISYAGMRYIKQSIN